MYDDTAGYDQIEAFSSQGCHVKLYLKAALRNKHKAFDEVARCYWYGIVVNSNKRVARIWYERAKELRDSEEIPSMTVQ